MKKIKCNNSLNYFGVYQNEEKNTYYLLMELCDCNMEKYIKDRGSPLNTYEILNLLNQLNQEFYLLEINICIPLYVQNYSKSQFMGTLDGTRNI